MLWFNRKKAKNVDVQKLKLQVEMVQLLLRNGYSWDQIFTALGFSDVWLTVVQNSLLKSKNK